MNAKEKIRNKVLFNIIGSAIILAVVFSVFSAVTSVMAAPPVALNDGYTTAINTPLTVPAPGLLQNDYDNEMPPTVSAVFDPTNGTIITYAADGSFVYMPATDYVGVDSFQYQIESGGQTDIASVYIGVYSERIYGCTIDQGGANDYIGQQDLTKMCTDVSLVNPDVFGINWNWDDIQGPGGNAYFACALFDSDEPGDGFVNYSICIQAIADDAGNLQYNQNQYYECNNNWTDRCGQPSAPIQTNYCSAAVSNDDPFGDPLNLGDFYPMDFQATCDIPNIEVGGEQSRLLNVCSYTSIDNPNSNPFDCVSYTGGNYGNLTIMKFTEPPTMGIDFEFTIDPHTLDETLTTVLTTNENGVGVSQTMVIEEDMYSVLETGIPSGWYLAGVSCQGQAGLEDPNNLPIEGGTNVVCTFINRAQVDVTIEKTDYDYDRGGAYPKYPCHGSLLPYTITVTNLDMPVDVPAEGVVVTDSLDANVSVTDPFDDYTIQSPFDNDGIPRSCTYDSVDHEVVCELGTMAPLEVVTIDFDVVIGYGAPLMYGIEMGDCTQGTPNMQGDVGVDVCNVVSVSATNEPEEFQVDNTASEPTDLGVPTAVALLSFEATGEAGAIRLDWETETETENQGFNLYRAPSLHAPRTKINEELIPGNTGGMGEVYSYLDEVNSRNTFYYWIESVDVYNYAELHEDYTSARALKKIK